MNNIYKPVAAPVCNALVTALPSGSIAGFEFDRLDFCGERLDAVAEWTAKQAASGRVFNCAAGGRPFEQAESIADSGQPLLLLCPSAPDCKPKLLAQAVRLCVQHGCTVFLGDFAAVVPGELTGLLMRRMLESRVDLQLTFRECVNALDEVDTAYEPIIVNTKNRAIAELPELRRRSGKLRRRILKRLAETCQINDEAGITVSPLAELGAGCTLKPGTVLLGATRIGDGCTLGPNTLISNSKLGRGCVINSTQIYGSTLDDDVKIGPFCHVRPNSHLCSGVRIGDFVEVKNSTVGERTKASHLTYIGDSDVGAGVNFGCGTITGNYDGVNHSRCVIGDGAFIGCNTSLVAPVSVGKLGYTAAGSTITQDVPDGALAICRAREQVIKEGWGERKLGEKNKL